MVKISFFLMKRSLFPTRVSGWKLGSLVSSKLVYFTDLGDEINLLILILGLGLGHPFTKYHGHPSKNSGIRGKL